MVLAEWLGLVKVGTPPFPRLSILICKINNEHYSARMTLQHSQTSRLESRLDSGVLIASRTSNVRVIQGDHVGIEAFRFGYGELVTVAQHGYDEDW